ncbi:winged helix-turn-helix domain-containing protein [Pantoea sp. B623]|uniref:winged helix-turn-helix domain-containing protein n=1 Tax=Pantoea sp. B623 TaxID=2974561 RepID=UPI002167AE57|nr:winged helix-turn-helix domain-containing protein [Pantoea sp. B623]MCS4492674.1 winged helix-turn-helix domain-containing protein [Pantoea sp. B623]
MSRKITINEFLIFEPDKKIITGRGRPVIISASASMCLELLIENAGQLVTHQKFYNFVWRRFGTEPASTALYQNLSALRRALNKAGLQEDIIRTMPRKGFILSPQTTISRDIISAPVSVTVQAEGIHAVRPDENSNLLNNENLLKKTISEEKQNVIHSAKKRLTQPFFSRSSPFWSALSFRELMTTMSFTLFFFIIVCFFSFRAGMDDENALFSYSTDYKGCKIYSKSDALLSTENVLKKIDQLKIDCRTAPYVYLTAYKNSDRLSYFSCQHLLDTSVRANCSSFYYVKNFNDE